MKISQNVIHAESIGQMNIKIIKILAYGSNKRFMWIQMPNSDVHVSEKLYNELYNYGVPTSQKLRWQKTN